MGFPPGLFSHPADIVAPYVLGSTLRRGPVALMITEVEAYLGEADPASHASRGPTPRCATMFGPPLHLYVYASYGIHRAGNVVCCPEGVASGLLLRAGRVIGGYDVVRSRRGDRPEDDGLARGPGNVGSALGLDLHLDGMPIVVDDGGVQTDAGNPEAPELWLSRARDEDDIVPYVTGPRIGISKNKEAPLRFWIPGDRSVTPPRSRPRRPTGERNS
ncbi:DNA-3-methyladenine glycosylase [Corynebacterium parakroppenstedtii]|uniref:DNA-3-methyladenine glycosylase n=1 Tax=Corynebacterium parakroppenstedtii TaxID=2828363 RepID=UPI001C8F31E8|nr:DNA-3-methyladenine glycosylase [Corynebacterium parakroppenstedtii]MBY0793827.1 DNA-3-methyladenine glycosylase [Corynebacterium parakroppenstedtii]